MFYVFIILLTLVFAVILELSQNTLLGWFLLLLGVASLILVRYFLMKKDKWSKASPVIGIIGLTAFLIFGCFISQPPYRQVKATDASSPEITDVIHVNEGDLTGVYNSDKSARIYAGIPYAAPPVGELRWREPSDPVPWEGVLACDTFAPMAMQPRGNVFYDSLSHILGYHDYRINPKNNYREAVSEDCLYLNVYTPAEDYDEPLPVLFYVHGGSLTTGQSYYSEYRGEELAKKGIIVVNFGYRLGVFGYYANEELAAESPNSTTGNYGLLDQIKALEWVNENIEAFGGDPSQITIAGESAGASSVNALCVSPLTEGMFVRAIADSSSIVANRPYHTFRSYDEALETGSAIMEEFNVSSVEELRQIPADKLVNTAYPNSSMTIDGYAITESPRDTYIKGNNHEQALLNGFNAKEADAFLLDTEATSDNYEELIVPILGEYAGEAAALYPPGSIVRDQSFIIDAGGDAKGALNHLYSAAWFTYSHHVWSDFMLAEGRPVYEYYFTKTNDSLSNYHAGELVYAFGNLWRHPGLYDESDYRLSELMQSYWVNFVKYGDPNGDGLPLWEQRASDSELLMELCDEPKMIEDPYIPIY
ncbi:MAG: carboxylesterase family protein, partial [Lachnospiraceae bacterium]|nr:carboxylesterase family protein [Lachnospiraceae bacterium]